MRKMLFEVLYLGGKSCYSKWVPLCSESLTTWKRSSFEVAAIF